MKQVGSVTSGRPWLQVGGRLNDSGNYFPPNKFQILVLLFHIMSNDSCANLVNKYSSDELSPHETVEQT